MVVRAICGDDAVAGSDSTPVAAERTPGGSRLGGRAVPYLLPARHPPSRRALPAGACALATVVALGHETTGRPSARPKMG